MHELSVAQGILDLVRRHVPGDQAGAVRAVTVRLGRLSGVVADSLDFCFGAIVAGTPFGGASLSIEHVPTRARCLDCAGEFEFEGLVFRCAACAGSHVRLVSGDELQVIAVELEDTPPEVT
jgi:hydrogenase nickel incorporation protein HypA/HybF